MSKEDLKIKPVDQEMTKEDLKKVNGGDVPPPPSPCPGGHRITK